MGWLKRLRAGLAAAEKASELAQDVRTIHRAWEEMAGNVAVLREALVDQQRRNDEMAVEWATTLDKIGRWASRQSARERRDTHKTLDELGEPRGSKAVRVALDHATGPDGHSARPAHGNAGEATAAVGSGPRGRAEVVAPHIPATSAATGRVLTRRHC